MNLSYLIGEPEPFFQDVETISNETNSKNVMDFFTENNEKKEIITNEDYLNRSERITTLAKEWYQKTQKKLSLSVAQEKLFRVSFTQNDKDYFLSLLRTLAIKVVRPCLRCMESVDDTYANAILDLIHPSFHIEMTITEKSRYFQSKYGPFLHVTLMEEGFEKTESIWGRKDKSHSISKRNIAYKNGELLADLGELFALLIILSVVKNAMADESERTYLEQRMVFQKPAFPCQFYEKDNYKVNEWKGTELVLLQKHFFESYKELGIHWDNIRYCKHEHYWALPFKEQPLTTLLTKLFFYWLEKRTGEVNMLKEYENLNAEYARSFEQKKNIPVKTLKAMEQSSLNQYFGFVEFDSIVDLDKVVDIEKEFSAFKETYFPLFTGSKKCAIRLRRLYNHKAIGLYYPGVKCLCVDVRNPHSFIHEYGHLLDFCIGNLSVSAEFATIRCLYEAYVDRTITENEQGAALFNAKGKYNRNYYCMPTEIFARSMELYFAFVKGINNSLLPTKEELEQDFAYPTQDKVYLNAIDTYFSALLEKYSLKTQDS